MAESHQIIDLARFLSKDTSDEKEWKADCELIAKFLHEEGLLIVRDPRVKEEDNERFLNQMENYYERTEQQKDDDVRKDLSYQVGYTPQHTEKARDHCERVKAYPEDERPVTICPPEKDPKVRFFWRMGELPPVTEFKQLNADPVIPKDFPGWGDVMNTWGKLMLQTIHTVSEMAAVGFGQSPDTYTQRMKFAPHLLAPTGSDLGKFNKLDTAFASFHYDLNFMTIHGRSRFPGLFVWTRDGKKKPVKVPAGCLLLQAGKQFEWLTGGHVLAGFHEVIVAPNTLEAVERAKAEKRSLWRVSSTLFGHIASDTVLEPLAPFSSEETVKKYPATKAGHQVQQELAAIALGPGEIAAN